MKKFFALFAVIACFGMMNAQTVRVLAIDNNSKLYVLDSLEYNGLDKSKNYDFHICVQLLNNSGSALNTGDTVRVQLSLNNSPRNLTFILNKDWESDSTLLTSLKGLAIPASSLVEGKFANEICAKVTEVYTHGGLRTITDAGFCGKFTVTFATGVAESAMDAISLYPNPVRNNLTIENADNVTVNIYAVNGQMVKSLVVNGTANVDMSDLSNGIYIVKMQSQGSISTKKIQVNH